MSEENNGNINNAVAAWLSRIETQVGRCLTRLDDLVRLESGHQQAVIRIADLENRMREQEKLVTALDKATPMNDLMKRVLFGAVGLIVTAFVVAMITLVVRGDLHTVANVVKSVTTP